MIRKDASDTIKRRLKYSGICPLCKKSIEEYEDFQFIKYPMKTQTGYAFFHTLCLVNARSIKVEEEDCNGEDIQVG